MFNHRFAISRKLFRLSAMLLRTGILVSFLLSAVGLAWLGVSLYPRTQTGAVQVRQAA